MDFMPALNSMTDVSIYIVAASIGLARMTGMIIVMPAFTRIGLTGILQAGVALALSLPLLPFILATVGPEPLGFAQMAGILLKETVVGMTIGLVLGVPIWAAEAAGEILDLQRGVTFAELVDPAYTTHNNIGGTFFAVVMVALFFYQRWPVAHLADGVRQLRHVAANQLPADIQRRIRQAFPRDPG